MKQILRVIFGCVAVGTLVLASGPAQAQTTSNGPYYATPAWDQQLQCDTQATCPRFIVLSNWIDASHPSGGAAVLDRETGLVWEQSPSTNHTDWEGAQVHCNQLAVGNRIGWRLPTLQELASLVDPTVSLSGVPTVPAGHPFSNVQFTNWSATTLYAGFAWYVIFFHTVPGNNNGFVDVDYTSNTNHAWCVRGGQGVNPQ